MCSQSISGSSLLSGYDEDDACETTGRSRREFEQIDAVLYDEEIPKRSSIKKICEEWSSKPHFRIRGHLYHIDRQQNLTRTTTTTAANTSSSSFDLLSSNLKISSLNSNELNTLLDDTTSGRSSIDSIEGSELTNNSDLDDYDDLDDADATNTILGDRFSGDAADSFDTDEDDDENGDDLSNISTHNRRKHPQLSIKCLKDSIISSLATSLFQQFLADQQLLLQRYAKYVCAKNSVALRPKLRPSSLPPRSLSQNRYSLPVGSSMVPANNAFQQQNQMMLTSTAFRATPEPNIKLNSLLRVTPLRISNSGPITNISTSPRKSQVSAPPPHVERTSTSLAIEKRNQQQISLIGTAVANLPIQLTLSTPQSSQNQIRQTPTTWRYRSATTINSNIQNSEPIPRLPPITIERLMSSDQLMINRSNTIATAIVESVPPATRAVSGTSTGSNLSSAMKLRALTNIGKLQKSSRPITISSTKDFNNSSSTSPTRSNTGQSIPSTALKSTAVTRTQHQQQKRPLVTTKAPPPSTSSGVLKISATHIC